ncbi:uncharacterized protein LOC132606120 [Lycium barbarum]|uniref:uncharacterized protein LOC132606120 n=1 Tax=Lycium barbarum TaxID=112863 RepID=UPI00293F28DB|nr:uncharacterized protein LOC132606120 [Lycium barbarum]
MAVQNRLATTDRLASWGMQVDTLCQLCNAGVDENHKHLFFECTYSTFIWKKLLHWMGINRQIDCWENEVAWLARRMQSKSSKWHMVGFVFAVAVYHIWAERNARKFQQVNRSNADRTKEIALQLHIAGRSQVKWFQTLLSLNSYPC